MHMVISHTCQSSSRLPTAFILAATVLLARTVNGQTAPITATSPSPTAIALGTSFTITISATSSNDTPTQAGYVTVSFPGLTDKSNATVVSSTTAPDMIGPGDPIYQNCSPVPGVATAVMFEIAKEGFSWPKNTTQSMTLRVTPTQVGTFDVLYR